MALQKSPNWGIGMRGPSAPNATMQDIRHFYIIEVHWGDAQPTSSSGISNSTASDIQAKVNAVRTYNTANTRAIADATFTSGSKTVGFTGTEITAADIGQYVYSPQNIPLGTKIASVNAGAHTCQLDTNAAANGTGITIGQPQGLRLRVECGQYTPSWAYAGLSSLVIKDNNLNPYTVAPWWAAGTQTVLGIANLGPIQANYAAFMAALAALTVSGGTFNGVTFPDSSVDQCPEIREVTVGLTMVKTGEVFFRYAGTDGNNASYAAAGYTSALDHAAMKRQMDIHGAAFLSTITHLDCNTFDTVTDNDGLPSAIAFTTDVIDYALGLGAYSVVRVPALQITNASMISGGSNATLYGTATSGMMMYGPLGTDATRKKTCAISFQTYQETQVNSGNVGATLARAIGFGATSVESINSSGSDTWAVIHAAEVASNYDQQLMQNFAPALPANYPWAASAPPVAGVPAEYPAAMTGPA